MGYADRIYSSGKPTCWGRPNTYDPNDPECVECRLRHSCASAVSSKRHSYSTSRPRTTPSRGETGVEVVRRSTEVVEQDESALARLGKDTVVGAMRGAAWEIYQFFCNYRIP